MASPRPDYTAELLRHFADLRDGTHGGASSRQDNLVFQRDYRIIPAIVTGWTP